MLFSCDMETCLHIRGRLMSKRSPFFYFIFQNETFYFYLSILVILLHEIISIIFKNTKLNTALLIFKISID